MQKVYILLRNNQQNGPYSLEELLQFELKPVDLIWIEGKSAGWYYPQEIAALHPHLSFVKPVAKETLPQQEAPVPNTVSNGKPKKIFVSMPVVMQKAPPEEKPRHLYMSQPEQASSPAPLITDEVKTSYTRSLEEAEADYTTWMYRQKTATKKGISRKGMIVAAAVVIVAGFSFAAIHYFSSKPEAVTAQIEAPPVAASEPVGKDDNIQTVSEKTVTATSVKKQTVLKKEAGAKKELTNKKISKPSLSQNDYDAGAGTAEKEVIQPATEAVQKGPQILKEEKAVVAEAPKEKKKKLREKILDLFKKKEPHGDEEAKPVEEEDGERRAVHRQSDATLAQQVHVKFTIPNDWMMGIKAAKLSLTNKSNQTITKAVIEVLYYSEDDELLQTKRILFGRIAAGETGSLSIPDHSFADHVDYKIISVESGEPVAGL